MLEIIKSFFIDLTCLKCGHKIKQGQAMCEKCIDESLEFTCVSCKQEFKGCDLHSTEIIDKIPQHTCVNCCSGHADPVLIFDNNIQF